MGIKLYTSCYKNMLERSKGENECYIKLSRTLNYPRKNVDGIYMKDLIDIDYGPLFGMFSPNMDEYKRNLETDKDLLEAADEFYSNLQKVLDCDDCSIFVLCFEDLDTFYTTADEKKSNGNVKAGEKKQCHRTAWAEFMNKRYKLNFEEYKKN